MKKSKRHLTIQQLVVAGMLSGISIFLGLTGLGFIPIPPIKATILAVPVIIGAIIEGPLVGALVGLIFGLFSIYNAIANPFPTSFMFINPIVAIIPRILIGLVTYWVYKALKNKFKRQGLSIGIAAFAGSMTNTIGVLGLAYIIYVKRYAEAFHISIHGAGIALATIGVTNGIPEAIVSIIITVAVSLTVLKIKRRK